MHDARRDRSPMRTWLPPPAPSSRSGCRLQPSAWNTVTSRFAAEKSSVHVDEKFERRQSMTEIDGLDVC